MENTAWTLSSISVRAFVKEMIDSTGYKLTLCHLNKEQYLTWMLKCVYVIEYQEKTHSYNKAGEADSLYVNYIVNYEEEGKFGEEKFGRILNSDYLFFKYEIAIQEGEARDYACDILYLGNRSVNEIDTLKRKDNFCRANYDASMDCFKYAKDAKLVFAEVVANPKHRHVRGISK